MGTRIRDLLGGALPSLRYERTEKRLRMYLGGELVADTVDLGVDRAQNLVTADNVGDRLLQPQDVQFSGESYRNRDVVPCRARIQLVEEPHALLRQRQRNPNRTHLRSQRRT